MNDKVPAIVSHSKLSSSLREKGQGMAEYIIIVILIAIIVLVGIRLFGKSATNQYDNATGEVNDLQAP